MGSAREQVIDHIRSLANEIDHLDPKDLIKTDYEFDFANYEVAITGSLNIAKILQQADFSLIPQDKLDAIRDSIKLVHETLMQIKNFSVKGYPENPLQYRDRFGKEIDQRYNGLFLNTSQYISLSQLINTDFAHIANDARMNLNQIRELKAAYEREAQDIIDVARQAAGLSATPTQINYFGLEAKQCKCRAFYWLGIAGLLAAGTIALLLWFVIYYVPKLASMNTTALIQSSISKVALFTLAYYLIIFSARMSRAQLHNFTVNKHRQNALETFSALVKSSGDEQTKNHILTYAAQAIFSPQVSGFQSKEGDHYGASQIFEVIKAVSPKSGRGQEHNT